MATPWPRPVEPRRSRASRLSVINARERPCWLSNSRPTSSKTRFLLVASTLTSTWAEGRMAASRFVVVVLQGILVAHYLAVELVDQFVDRRVQVGVGTFGKQVTAFDMDVALRS